MGVEPMTLSSVGHLNESTSTFDWKYTADVVQNFKFFGQNQCLPPLKMEKFTVDSVWDNLIQVLAEGRQLSMQLQMNLHAQHSSSSSDEISEYLLRNILHSYDHALYTLQNGSDPPPPVMSGTAMETTGSPQTDDSDKDLKGQQDPIARDAVSNWRPRVEVYEKIGSEGQLEDGYRWRKYGQKDILGAKYPRGYYRCIRKYDQGCPATKQVQRSDKDPILLEITYKRSHTCNQLVDNPLHPNKDPNPSLGPEQYDPNRYPESFDPLSFPSVNSAHSQCELSKIFSTTSATESESNFSFGELGWYPK